MNQIVVNLMDLTQWWIKRFKNYNGFAKCDVNPIDVNNSVQKNIPLTKKSKP